MKINSLRTRLVQVNESLLAVLDQYLPSLQEKDVVVITSKLVSVCEGRVVKAPISKYELIKQESDLYLDEPNPHGVVLTVMGNLLIPNSGIDESNANGAYILYPLDVFLSAQRIWEHLRQRDDLQDLGVIITDSHTTPMRWGVTGVALGWCGLEPLNNYINTPDCFGRMLKFTKVNVVDALATAAVFTMGEGNEQTPLALISDISKVTFRNTPPSSEEIASLHIPMEEDIYGPLLVKGSWKRFK
jgi:putative folate metabolism gamma-glutamate ligase